MIADYGLPGDVASRTFRVFAHHQPIRVVETPPLDAAERERLAAAYRQLPSYCHIYDPAGMHLHVAHLGANEDVELAIEVDEEITSFRVEPPRRGGARHATGRRLTFTTGAHGARYFVVRVNALPPLLLVVDEPEEIPAGPDVLDAREFLAAPVPDHTTALQRALAAVNGTGRTLVVPAGVYSIAQLHVCDGRDFRLHLAAGCLLKVRPSAHGENEHRHGLWLENCTDVALTGLGGIDHQAYEHYVLGGNDYQHGMVDYYTANDLCPWITQSPLFLTGSRQIRIEGVTLRNGRNFNLNCRGCDDVTIRRVKILTPAACTPEYADGINTGSCRRVLVEDCLVAANDDAFASGHYFAPYDQRPSADHVIRGLLGWNLRGSGARLGFYAAHDQGDFTFERCDFLGMAHTSLLIHALRPPADGAPPRYGTLRVHDCRFDARHLLALLTIEGAAIDRLEFRDVEFVHAPGTLPVEIAGSLAAPIGTLVFERVICHGRPILSTADLPGSVAHVREVIFR